MKEAVFIVWLMIGGTQADPTTKVAHIQFMGYGHVGRQACAESSKPVNKTLKPVGIPNLQVVSICVRMPAR